MDVWRIFHTGNFENIAAQPHKTSYLVYHKSFTFLFRRYSIWISAGARHILIEVHVTSLQANAGRVLWPGNDRFLSDSSHSSFICCRTICLCDICDITQSANSDRSVGLLMAKVTLVINKLNIMPLRRMGGRMYGFMHSWSRHQTEVSGQLHGPVALSPRNENNIVTLDIRARLNSIIQRTFKTKKKK